jgi:hypothetical protein
MMGLACRRSHATFLILSSRWIFGSARGRVFSAADVQVTYQELKRRGVTFNMELISHEHGEGEGDREARFLDPDGNEFLLYM